MSENSTVKVHKNSYLAVLSQCNLTVKFTVNLWKNLTVYLTKDALVIRSS